MFTKLLLTLAAGLAASTLAHAEGVQANIPFAFSVGKSVMPAGTYCFDTEVAPTVLRVRSQNWEKAAMVITTTAQQRNKDEIAKIVFHKYGEVYFLSQVIYAGGAGRALPATAREKEMLARIAGPELKVLAVK
ncbi:MAG: hypothetical protein JST93_16500 [Acidobacteria bacterium]|nr:hypothetical protein [Acidobacteriota bacterium]